MPVEYPQKQHMPVRGFVIPVLDYSPASEYNILTLLADLEPIDGEVIVIFNGASVGEELKDHPRITRYAIMKQNVGVARAWNIGIQMAEAELVHIVNADAHISLAAVESLESGLRSLDKAVCVAPQGSFFNFRECRDYVYFDKGSFSDPIRVDAVSGFFFCVNRRIMSENGIVFDNRFTPCYFEEWDFGLQVKQAGLSCWVVPTVCYDHYWSGTIGALRTIPYMGREESYRDIRERNRKTFIKKWVDMVGSPHRSGLLESGYKYYLQRQIMTCLDGGRLSEATEHVDWLGRLFMGDQEAEALKRYAEQQIAKLSSMHADGNGRTVK